MDGLLSAVPGKQNGIRERTWESCLFCDSKQNVMESISDIMFETIDYLETIEVLASYPNTLMLEDLRY